jgi:hypothetical protein
MENFFTRKFFSSIFLSECCKEYNVPFHFHDENFKEKMSKKASDKNIITNDIRKVIVCCFYFILLQ